MRTVLRTLALIILILQLGCGGTSEMDNSDQGPARGHASNEAVIDSQTPPTLHPPRIYEIQLSAGSAQSVVYEAARTGYIVLLELHSDRIQFTALTSRASYEEVFAGHPPTYYRHKGAEYVKDDGLLFWGSVGKPESILIDGEPISGFELVNKSQISATGSTAQVVLKLIGTGDVLTLDKHYWDSGNHKRFPAFQLEDVRDSLGSLSPSTSTTFNISEEGVRCMQRGDRKYIWVEAPVASFALNGHAMDLVKRSYQSGSPWLDSAGRPILIGRDVLDSDTLAQLIDAGLRECDGM